MKALRPPWHSKHYFLIRRYSSCPALAEEKQKRDKAHLQELTNTQAPSLEEEIITISTITIIFGPVAFMGAAGRRIYPHWEGLFCGDPTSCDVLMNLLERSLAVLESNARGEAPTNEDRTRRRRRESSIRLSSTWGCSTHCIRPICRRSSCRRH